MSAKIQDGDFISTTNFAISQVNFYSSTLICSIGIVANILNFLLCLNERIQKRIMGIFNLLMSIFNILSLTSILIIYLPPSAGNQDLTLTSDFSCKMLHYFNAVCVQMVAWLNVMVTLERIAFISQLSLAKFVKNKKTLGMVLVGLFAFNLITNIPTLLFKVINDETNQTVKYITCTSTSTVVLIDNINASTTRLFLPIILQIVLSIVLIIYLKKNKNKYNNNSSPVFKNEYRCAFTVVILNLIYIVTQIPFMILKIYFSILDIIPNYPLTAGISRSLAIGTLVYFCTMSLSLYMFCSLLFVNIFLNKQIRKEIRFIFCGVIATQNVKNKSFGASGVN
jgi:hypothetical protein